MALHAPTRNPIAKPMVSIADAIVDAVTPPRRALSSEAIQAEIRALRDRAAERRARLDAVRSYRRRWLQATEDEVVELAVQRLRRRSAAHAPMIRRRDKRRPAAR